MHILRIISKLVRVVVGSRETSCIYTYCRQKQQAGAKDPSVEVFDARTPPPPRVKELVSAKVGWIGYWFMHRRMVRYGGKLLCLRIDGELAAYGWIQGWRPFRHRYRWLLDDAIMLGFFWTAPRFRGRGLYGRLLAHSIAVCDERERIPLIVAVGVSNTSSQRGVDKAGFTRIGVYEMTRRFFSLFTSVRVIEQDDSAAAGLRRKPFSAGASSR